MTDTNLYSQDVWDKGYEKLEFGLPPSDDQVRRWMEKNLPKNGGSCLEIGCFPGRYLAVCGNFGYELNGIDLTPRVGVEMVQWLKSKGYRVGQCQRGDFFKMDEQHQFDVVYSNGFIEHFTDWQSVLKKHARLVKHGGTLMLTTPNFSGRFQKLFHEKLDRENHERHYLPSMDPRKWAEVLGADFEILVCEYFDKLDFWVGEQKRSVPQKLGFWTLRAMLPVLRALPAGNPSYAPYCGLVARRIR